MNNKLDQRASTSVMLQVQTVIYENSSESILKSIGSLVTSIVYARELGWDIAVNLMLGDSSEVPALNSGAISDIQKLAFCIDATVDYRFFGSNLGSAGGHNQLFDDAAKKYNSDVILIMNPDIFVSPPSLYEMLRELSRTNVAAAEARQIPLQHPKDWDKATGYTGWVSTAFTIIKRDVFESLGKFDSDNFFLYCDDVDFSWRARLAGFRLIFVPTASVFHDKRLDTDGSYIPSNAEKYYSIEAALMLAWKYSNDVRLRKLLDFGAASKDPLWARAVTEAGKKLSDRSPASRLDPDHKVAEFIGDDYARHVFKYGG